MADDRTYIRVHDGMDEHPKIEGLSDAAFRALHRCWYYCSRNRTDGRLTDATWKNRAKTPKVRRELVDAGLAHLPGHDCDHPDCPPTAAGHVQMHDYLDHQRSAAEIAEIKAGRGSGGTYGNHIRWHVKRRVNDPKCDHCNPADPIANGSQDRSDDRSQTDRSPIANPSHSQRQRQIPTEVQGGRSVTNASDSPPRFPDHCPDHADVAVPPPCGGCQKQKAANRSAGRHLTAVAEPPTQRCLIHAEPDVRHCRGCAADRKAIS